MKKILLVACCFLLITFFAIPFQAFGAVSEIGTASQDITIKSNVIIQKKLTVQGGATSQFNGALKVLGDGDEKGLMIGNADLDLTTKQNLIYGNIDTDSKGNLMLLQNESADKFKVDKDGNVTAIKFTGSLTGNATSATTATNLVGAQWSIPYQSTTNITAMLASVAEDSGKFLKSNGAGAPTWATVAGGISGSGIDNYIPRWNGTNALESSVIYQADTTGNVGIGTTTPAFKLSLAGTSALDRKIGINGTQVVYLPDQAGTAFTGSLFIGNGGNSLSHTSEIEGHYNTGLGINTLYSNTTGSANSAIGLSALYSNAAGVNNSAMGYSSLYSNTEGDQNSVIGSYALYSNIIGTNNSAMGFYSLYSNTGYNNSVVGARALFLNTSGFQNSAIGMNAGSYIANGKTANETSNNSLYLGCLTRALESGGTNEIVIGANTIGNGSNSATLGNTSITKTILNGNVGIGTTGPLASLEVKRNTTDTNFAAWIEGTNDKNYGLGVNILNITSDKAIADFRSGNVSKLFIRADGNVGIGTTTPGRKLDVNGYLTINGNLLTQMEGGAYFGRVGVKENQWGLSNYGNTWTAKDLARFWQGVAMSSDGKIQTAVVSGEQIFISSDYGNTWTAKDSARNWQGVAMSSDGKIQTATTLNGQIYISSDYGNTWTAKDSARNWLGVAMSSDGKIQTAVVFNGQIYVSYTASFINGNVGIGTTTPLATLDVNGFVKLEFNSTAPVTCNATVKGSIALTSTTKMCICDGTNWVLVNTATSCTW